MFKTNKIMKNSIKVNYDLMLLTLMFEGVVHEFDLKKGDAGEFWHGFQHKGLEFDLNFHINDDNLASASVYGTELDDFGEWHCNTSDETYIDTKDVEEVGDKDKYLSYWWYKDLRDDINKTHGFDESYEDKRIRQQEDSIKCITWAVKYGIILVLIGLIIELI